MEDTNTSANRKTFCIPFYSPGEPYVPPSEEELALFQGEFEDLIYDNTANIDQRTAVRIFLTLRKVRYDLLLRLAEPYDLGFHKKSDGKSHPVEWARIPRFLRVLHFKKDIVSVRHDLDYYRGFTDKSKKDETAVHWTPEERKLADELYYEGQLAVGERKWICKLEYWALRLFGGCAWAKSQARTDKEARFLCIEETEY